jgi:hypothetical protein
VAAAEVAEGAAVAVSAAADDANREDAATSGASARRGNIVPRSREANVAAENIRAENVTAANITVPNIRVVKAGAKSGLPLVDTAQDPKAVSAAKDVVRKEDATPKNGAASDLDQRARNAAPAANEPLVSRPGPSRRALLRNLRRIWTISEPACSTRAPRPKRLPEAKRLTKRRLANGGGRPPPTEPKARISRGGKTEKTSKSSRNARKPAVKNALKRASGRLVGDEGGDVRVHDATERLDRWIGRGK